MSGYVSATQEFRRCPCGSGVRPARCCALDLAPFSPPETSRHLAPIVEPAQAGDCLGHAPEWRWLAGWKDGPWYPTLRLYREAAPRGRAELTPRVAWELQRSVAEDRTPGRC